LVGKRRIVEGPEPRMFSSESVTSGHPDKVADQISDAVLDAMIAQDRRSRVAVETLVTTGLVFVAGEVTTRAYVEIPALVRKVVREIGYTDSTMGFDADTCAVITSIHEQSPDINRGVDRRRGEQGAGDQGLMFGYACRETRSLMPLPIQLAHRICERLEQVRKKGILPWLRPDGKSQVTIEYENGKPIRLDTVVVACQYSDDKRLRRAGLIRADGCMTDRARAAIIAKVIKPVVLAEAPQLWRDKGIHYCINRTGKFVLGGPHADTGLTGRKIIVDTYGGRGSHGGGCFSGKDPSKVDRSASYMARYIAKNIVAARLAEACEVQLAYVIGQAEPVSVLVTTNETGKLSDTSMQQLVRECFPLKPAQIIRHLNLLRPIYRKTAAYGHFGRELPEFTWEKTDMVRKLRSKAKLR